MHPVRSADLAHVMTLVARDTVIASRDIAGDLGALDPPCIPDRRIADIAGLFRDYVPNAGDWVGSDEPSVGIWQLLQPATGRRTLLR